MARTKPGMVLGRAVYDVQGQQVLLKGAKLDEENVGLLARASVSEILIEDSRVADVPVGALYPADLEAKAVKALHVLTILKQGTTEGVTPAELTGIQTAVHQMAENLFPIAMGDPDLCGSSSLEGYNYLHPVKVAGLSMLIGREVGLDESTVVKLGTAAMLQNIGYLSLSPGILEKTGPLTEQDWQHVRKHPENATAILANSGLDVAVIRTIQEHHERWSGSGYPEGRKGNEIILPAQIIGMADTYHSLLSRRPHRPAFKPHEAVEFIVAYSGDLFSPELAQIFARRVPQYPAGLGVKLNTGEVAIVSDPNLGHIARPVVRICSKDGQALKKPFDLDLSLAEHMHILIVEVLL